MRAGLIIYGSLETLSGGYLYDRMLVAHLRAQGDHVEVFSLPWRGYGRHLTDNLRRGWLEHLRRARLDVLLEDELNHPSLFWLNRRLRPTVHYPIVSIVHHLRSSEARPVWQNWLYARVEAAYLTTVNSFVFNSAVTQAAVAPLVGAARPGLVAHPGGDRLAPGITAAEIRARARQPGPLRILFVGNLIPRKGLHTLLAALARLPAETWRLTVVGDPGVDRRYTAVVHREIRRWGDSHQVEIAGKVDDAELVRRLHEAHVLATPSSYEGFGIVYLEGMGFGLPAIASTAGGASEIVREGDNGFLVAPGDAAALAARLEILHSDRARLAEMGVAARRHYLAQPTWNETCARIRSYLLLQNR